MQRYKISHGSCSLFQYRYGLWIETSAFGLLPVLLPHSQSGHANAKWIRNHLRQGVLPLSHYTDNPKYLQSPFLSELGTICTALWSSDSITRTRKLLTLQMAPLQLSFRISSPLLPVSPILEKQLATSPLAPGQRVSHFRHTCTSTPHLPSTISLIAAVNKSRL